MPDALFEEPRLASLYDAFDDDRSDLDVYLAIAEELGAQRVLDVGCGTGTLALLMAARGLDVVAVDPAAAMLEAALAKPAAHEVHWLHGDATTLPDLNLDLAFMTGNVAQAIVDPDDWGGTLRGIHSALSTTGFVVFETRDPARRAWEEWTRELTYRSLDTVAGRVERWIQVTDVQLPLVAFTTTFLFGDGTELLSKSTLRFRERQEIEADLRSTGYELVEVRDAPDRPGKELVFFARRA